MFEWHEDKRNRNLARHGLDLVDAAQLFDGRPIVTFPARSEQEMRYLTTGEIRGHFYSLVWTWRGEVQRLISFRRAREKEKAAYYQAFRQ